MRARIAGAESRSSYFAAAQRNFEFYIDLLMQMHAEHPDQGLDAAALQASERARARSLLDMLVEAHADIHQGADPTAFAAGKAVAAAAPCPLGISGSTAERAAHAGAGCGGSQRVASPDSSNTTKPKHEFVQPAHAMRP